jgi:hypothetical protein
MPKKNASFSRAGCILCGVVLPISGKREGKPSLFCIFGYLKNPAQDLVQKKVSANN